MKRLISRSSSTSNIFTRSSAILASRRGCLEHQCHATAAAFARGDAQFRPMQSRNGLHNGQPKPKPFTTPVEPLKLAYMLRTETRREAFAAILDPDRDFMAVRFCAYPYRFLSAVSSQRIIEEIAKRLDQQCGIRPDQRHFLRHFRAHLVQQGSLAVALQQRTDDFFRCLPVERKA